MIVLFQDVFDRFRHSLVISPLLSGTKPIVCFCGYLEITNTENVKCKSEGWRGTSQRRSPEGLMHWGNLLQTDVNAGQYDFTCCRDELFTTRVCSDVDAEPARAAAIINDRVSRLH